MQSLLVFLRACVRNLKDVAPIIGVIAFFQLVVLQQPLPDVGSFIGGLIVIVLGLTFFVFGLELGLFPLGEAMAYQFARKGSVFWLLLFAFALGCGTTAAEPALIAVADEAAQLRSKAAATAREKAALAATRSRIALRPRSESADATSSVVGVGIG